VKLEPALEGESQERFGQSVGVGESEQVTAWDDGGAHASTLA
jgi:hypothetical protein